MASIDVCPPVPDIITDASCTQSSCQKDTDCLGGFRCCFTECSFTCLPKIQPAALVDWRKEPRRSRSVEACSTSSVESDEDPLLCPHGYFCHVTDPGNRQEGIPNSGYCVKHVGEKSSPGEEDIVIASALAGRKTCKVDNVVLLDGAKIKLGDKHCRCKKGYMSCKKRLRKSNVKKKPKHREIKRRSKRRKGRNKWL